MVELLEWRAHAGLSEGLGGAEQMVDSNGKVNLSILLETILNVQYYYVSARMVLTRKGAGTAAADCSRVVQYLRRDCVAFDVVPSAASNACPALAVVRKSDCSALS